MEWKLRELLAEDFGSFIVGEGFAAVKAGKRVRAGHSFEVEDDGVLAQETSGLGRGHCRSDQGCVTCKSMPRSFLWEEPNRLLMTAANNRATTPVG